MFSHIMVGADDIDAAKKFYDACFIALGGRAGSVDPKGRVMYMKDGSIFIVTKPIDGNPACHANGGTIGFNVDSPEMAEAWHKAGLENGGTAIEDPPGIREGGGMKMHLAYLRDPAGNKLCTLLRIP